MRILIVKLGSIGDIIHTLPSLAAIRKALPDAEISWVAEERSAEILRGLPLIDNLIEVDTQALRGGMVIEEILLNASKQLKGLRQFKFDVAIDFQGLWKSAMIAKLSGARRRWGFARDGLREPSSRIMITDTVDTPRHIHVIEKNLMLAEGALTIGAKDARVSTLTGQSPRASGASRARAIPRSSSPGGRRAKSGAGSTSPGPTRSTLRPRGRSAVRRALIACATASLSRARFTPAFPTFLPRPCTFPSAGATPGFGASTGLQPA